MSETNTTTANHQRAASESHAAKRAEKLNSARIRRRPDSTHGDISLSTKESFQLIDEKLGEQFQKVFPSLNPHTLADPTRTWLLGAISNFAGLSFGSYQDPDVAGFVESTTDQNVIKHLNWHYLKSAMKGIFRIQLKGITHMGYAKHYFVDNSYEPFVDFATGDTVVTSAQFEGTNTIVDSAHYLLLRKNHLEAGHEGILTVRLFAKRVHSGFKKFLNMFRKDVHLGRKELRITDLMEPGIHEIKIPLDCGNSRKDYPIIQFSIEYLSVEDALKEMGKDEFAEAWKFMHSTPGVQNTLPDKATVTEEAELPSRPFLKWNSLTRKTQLGDLDFQPIAFIDAADTGTQAWVHFHEEKKIIVVAFRGTEVRQGKDLMTDASFLPTNLSMSIRSNRYNPKCLKTLTDLRILVHAGFRNAYDSIRESILRIVYDVTGWDKSWTVCVCGHSLGGALATLCAFEIANRKMLTPITFEKKKSFGRIKVCTLFGTKEEKEENGPRVAMISLGAPKVGNLFFVNTYNSTVTLSLRIANPFDPVCRLPGAYYRHTKQEIIIGENGVIQCNGKMFTPDGKIYDPDELPSIHLQKRSKNARTRDISKKTPGNSDDPEPEHSDFSATSKASSSGIKKAIQSHLQPQYFRNIENAIVGIIRETSADIQHALQKVWSSTNFPGMTADV